MSDWDRDRWAPMTIPMLRHQFCARCKRFMQSHFKEPTRDVVCQSCLDYLELVERIRELKALLERRG